MTKKRFFKLNKAERAIEKTARELFRQAREFEKIASEESTAGMLGEIPDFSHVLTESVEQIFAGLAEIKRIGEKYEDFERESRKALLRKK